MKNTSYQTYWGYIQIIFGKKFKSYLFVLKKKDSFEDN